MTMSMFKSKEELYKAKLQQAEKELNNIYPESLSMDVGINTHPEFRPYSLNEVLVKLYKKSISKTITKKDKI